MYTPHRPQHSTGVKKQCECCNARGEAALICWVVRVSLLSLSPGDYATASGVSRRPEGQGRQDVIKVTSSFSGLRSGINLFFQAVFPKGLLSCGGACSGQTLSDKVLGLN